jgi:hypothetical protein
MCTQFGFHIYRKFGPKIYTISVNSYTDLFGKDKYMLVILLWLWPQTRGKLLWKSSYTSTKIPKNLWKNPQILLNPRIPKSLEISKNCIKYLEKPE